jgi:hypothetical protein
VIIGRKLETTGVWIENLIAFMTKLGKMGSHWLNSQGVLSLSKRRHSRWTPSFQVLRTGDLCTTGLTKEPPDLSRATQRKDRRWDPCQSSRNRQPSEPILLLRDDSDGILICTTPFVLGDRRDGTSLWLGA